MRELLIDSSALISYCKLEEGERIAGLLENCSPCVAMPAYAEVARYFRRNYGQDRWESVKIRLEKFRLIPLTTSACELAAELSTRYPLAIMDSLIYACALENRLELLTRDADLKGKKGVIFVKS